MTEKMHAANAAENKQKTTLGVASILESQDENYSKLKSNKSLKELN